MKKVLISIIAVLLVILLALGGYLLYQYTHIFVEDAVYAKSAEMLDLRGTGISVEHYLSVREQLPECEVFWDVPFQGGSYSNDIETLTITSLTEADRAMLPYFSRLKKIVAGGCSDYDQLEALKLQLPKVEVVYQVDLGGKLVEPDATELTLGAQEVTLEALMENLKHLPSLQSLTLSKTAFNLEEIAALQEAYPEVQMDYTVALLAEEYASDVQSVDLSAMTGADVEAVCAALPMLPQLTDVELMSGGTSPLSLEDVKALNDAAPQVVYHYTFSFNGKTISTTDETVHFSGSRLKDVDPDGLRKVLDVMENCDRFVLEYWNYGSLNNELMGQIREEYAGRTKLVWRVFFGVGYCLTDVDVLRCTYDLTDSNSSGLYYCNEVRYVDFGHDTALKDASFMSGMTSLEVAILSGSMIRNLEPLAGLPNLKILEVSNCGYLEDISPLAQCPSLKMLNISYTAVSDLSALDDMELELMCAVKSKMNQEEKDRFVEQHPECLATYTGNEYGTGWRYLEDGHKREWYEDIAVAFKYPHAPNMAGWYLK